MILKEALDISKVLAKHNPFVRMTREEQRLANQAGTLLSRAANTEELQDLIKREDLIALF